MIRELHELHIGIRETMLGWKIGLTSQIIKLLPPQSVRKPNAEYS